MRGEDVATTDVINHRCVLEPDAREALRQFLWTILDSNQ